MTAKAVPVMNQPAVVKVVAQGLSANVSSFHDRVGSASDAGFFEGLGSALSLVLPGGGGALLERNRPAYCLSWLCAGPERLSRRSAHREQTNAVGRDWNISRFLL